MSPAPRALILSSNALEAQDLAEMLESFFGMTSAICRSIDAALDVARANRTSLEVAFLGASTQATDLSGLIGSLRDNQSTIVLIDAEPVSAQAQGLRSLLRPFSAEHVRAALGNR